MQKVRVLASLVLAVAVLLCDTGISADAARCLYVSSYHAEYEWDAGIRKGLRPELAGHCELTTFFMDTKRNKREDFARQKATEALALIRHLRPDVIIAADDNASRYLVEPHLKDGATPVVFCGINNSAEPYGYPYRTATGMVEVTPVQPMLRTVREVIPGVRRGIFIAADVLSQRRMFERLHKSFAEENIELQAKFVADQETWEAIWQTEEPADFLFIGNPAGIEGWDCKRARAFVNRNTTKLTLSAWDWLAPLATITITKVPEEQGEWAGKVAREILRGAAPSMIPVVINRRWHRYVNESLLAGAGIELPAGLLVNALGVD